MTLRVSAAAAADDLCFNIVQEAALLRGGSHTFCLCYVGNTLRCGNTQKHLLPVVLCGATANEIIRYLQ